MTTGPDAPQHARPTLAGDDAKSKKQTLHLALAGGAVLLALMVCGVVGAGGYFVYAKRQKKTAVLPSSTVTQSSGSRAPKASRKSSANLSMHEDTRIDACTESSVSGTLKRNYRHLGFKQLSEKTVAGSQITTVALGKGSGLGVYRVMHRNVSSREAGHKFATALGKPSNPWDYRVGDDTLVYVTCVQHADYSGRLGPCTVGNNLVSDIVKTLLNG